MAILLNLVKIVTYPHFPIFFLKTLVSSANVNILLVTPPSRPLMYIKNKIGPTTDHCVTPI